MRYRSRGNSGNQKLQAFAALILMYPFVCLVLWVMKISTPAKGEFMGGEVDMSLQKGFANWLYEQFVSAPAIVLCFAVAGFLIWLSKKASEYQRY